MAVDFDAPMLWTQGLVIGSSTWNWFLYMSDRSSSEISSMMGVDWYVVPNYIFVHRCSELCFRSSPSIKGSPVMGDLVLSMMRKSVRSSLFRIMFSFIFLHQRLPCYGRSCAVHDEEVRVVDVVIPIVMLVWDCDRTMAISDHRASLGEVHPRASVVR
jgi:hypothetical protein